MHDINAARYRDVAGLQAHLARQLNRLGIALPLSIDDVYNGCAGIPSVVKRQEALIERCVDAMIQVTVENFIDSKHRDRDLYNALAKANLLKCDFGTFKDVLDEFNALGKAPSTHLFAFLCANDVVRLSKDIVAEANMPEYYRELERFKKQFDQFDRNLGILIGNTLPKCIKQLEKQISLTREKIERDYLHERVATLKFYREEVTRYKAEVLNWRDEPTDFPDAPEVPDVADLNIPSRNIGVPPLPRREDDSLYLTGPEHPLVKYVTRLSEHNDHAFSLRSKGHKARKKAEQKLADRVNDNLKDKWGALLINDSCRITICPRTPELAERIVEALTSRISFNEASHSFSSKPTFEYQDEGWTMRSSGYIDRKLRGIDGLTFEIKIEPRATIRAERIEHEHYTAVRDWMDNEDFAKAFLELLTSIEKNKKIKMPKQEEEKTNSSSCVPPCVTVAQLKHLKKIYVSAMQAHALSKSQYPPVVTQVSSDEEFGIPAELPADAEIPFSDATKQKIYDRIGELLTLSVSIHRNEIMQPSKKADEFGDHLKWGALWLALADNFNDKRGRTTIEHAIPELLLRPLRTAKGVQLHYRDMQRLSKMSQDTFVTPASPTRGG